jgi:hypothetical protein
LDRGNCRLDGLRVDSDVRLSTFISIKVTNKSSVPVRVTWRAIFSDGLVDDQVEPTLLQADTSKEMGAFYDRRGTPDLKYRLLASSESGAVAASNPVEISEAQLERLESEKKPIVIRDLGGRLSISF